MKYCILNSAQAREQCNSHVLYKRHERGLWHGVKLQYFGERLRGVSIPWYPDRDPRNLFSRRYAIFSSNNVLKINVAYILVLSFYVTKNRLKIVLFCNTSEVLLVGVFVGVKCNIAVKLMSYQIVFNYLFFRNSNFITSRLHKTQVFDPELLHWLIIFTIIF